METEFDIIKEGVYRVKNDSFNVLTSSAISFIKSDCKVNILGRSRINFHNNDDDKVHEMIIAMRRDTEIRIHKHICKSESFNVIEGKLAVILFLDNLLTESKVIILENNYNPYYRLNNNYYHLVIPLSEIVVMMETTNGPFDSSLTKYINKELAEKERDVIKYFRRELN